LSCLVLLVYESSAYSSCWHDIPRARRRRREQLLQYDVM